MVEVGSFTIYSAQRDDASSASYAMAEWRRRAGGSVATVDAQRRDEVVALCGGGLFGGEQWAEVLNVELVEPTWFDVGGDAHLAGVYLWRDARARKKIDRLGDVARIETIDDAWKRRELRSMFTTRGVEVSREAHRLLVERCRGDVLRASSVARGAQMAGLDRLGESQCRQLLGSHLPGSTLFDVVDAVLDGRMSVAVGGAEGLEPVVVASQLSLAVAAVLVSHELGEARKVAAVCGLHPFVASKRVAAARRWDRGAALRALEAATWCEVRSRRGEISGPEIVARVGAALAGAAVSYRV
jgi:hypothetical protein